MSTRKDKPVERYVIRYRDDAMQRVDFKWIPNPGATRAEWMQVGKGKWSEGRLIPHPDRGLYIKDGGHLTPNLQDAKVFRADVRKGRAFHPSIHELVQVSLVRVLPKAMRG